MPWIYTVEQPVEAQSEEERQRAAGVALLVVLSRVSGLASVPRSELVAQALENPDRYYDQFVFFSKNEQRAVDNSSVTTSHGGAMYKQAYVKVSFQPAAVLRLAREAELPIWWSQRPQVLAWIAVDGDGPRRIVAGASSDALDEGNAVDDQLRGHLDAYARRRGVPLALPEAQSRQVEESRERQVRELEVLPQVTSSDVWRRDIEILREASLARDGQVVAVARMQLNAGGLNAPAELQRYSGEWRIWLGDEPVTERFRGATLEEVAAQGAAFMANLLAERYAVLPRERRRLALRIEGVDDVTRYAQLMRYLATLEFLERYQVNALRDNAVYVAVETRAQMSQLSMLLTQGERLIDPNYEIELNAQPLGTPPGFTIEPPAVIEPVALDGLRLVWQG